MSLIRATRALTLLLMLVVLVVSGVYVLVYLYRWEWNRALISGLFLVSSEVALVGWLVLGRLRELASEHPARAPEREVEHRPFRWLEDASSSGAAVFVPFLLGAGVLLSALAYVVERVARWSAPVAPVVDFGPIAFPGNAAPVRPRRALVVAAWIVAIALVTVTIQRIGDATQSRPDLGPTPESSAYALRIEDRRGAVSVRETSETAEALWVTCRPVLPDRLRPDATIVTTASGRATLRLTPGLGYHAERRLTGCLSDAVLTRVQATVEEVRYAVPVERSM